MDVAAKKIILFGIGNNGKKMMRAYEEYDAYFEVVAIADNHPSLKHLGNVDVILVEQIQDFDYDEIWISSIYYQEIKRQLVDELGILPSRVRYVEYPMPFLEKTIYDKYREEIVGNQKCYSDELQEVVDFISENGVRMYCYPFYDEYMEREVPVYYDKECDLYYGICFGRRMYLARQYDTPQKAAIYLNYVCMEQDRRSPHCYLKEGYKIESGEVGIDVGAAEGVFALQILDKAKHIYLIEADARWCEALDYTFQSDKDKVTVIQGYASDVDQGENLSLDTFFADKEINFIKMDIEGAEMKALQGASELIKRCSPKLAVCTYHNAEDEANIRMWMEKSCGYAVKSSSGYVICQGEWELEHIKEVDFRRALVWAERKQK